MYEALNHSQCASYGKQRLVHPQLGEADQTKRLPDVTQQTLRYFEVNFSNCFMWPRFYMCFTADPVLYSAQLCFCPCRILETGVTLTIVYCK